MSIGISGGPSGITVETDPTALKLTGGTLSGELSLPQVGNLLNENLVVDSYNDTGAGTHYYHTFTPFDGKFNLATNGGGLTFPDGTTQTTAGLPLTGGTLTGKVTAVAPTSTNAGFNVGSINSTANLTNSVAGDMWLGTWQLTYKTNNGTLIYGAATNASNVFGSPQVIDTTNASPALRVTQKGTGPALVVEDETTPDTSAFLVSSEGRVGINILPASPPSSDLYVLKRAGSTYATQFAASNGVCVYVYNDTATDTALLVNKGIAQFDTGIKVSSAGAVVSSILAPVVATGTYDKEIAVTINSINYRIPCRQV